MFFRVCVHYLLVISYIQINHLSHIAYIGFNNECNLICFQCALTVCSFLKRRIRNRQVILHTDEVCASQEKCRSHHCRLQGKHVAKLSTCTEYRSQLLVKKHLSLECTRGVSAMFVHINRVLVTMLCAGDPLQRVPEGAPVHYGHGAIRGVLPERGARGAGSLPA